MKGAVFVLAWFTFACLIGVSVQQCVTWSDPPFDENEASVFDDAGGTPVGFRRYNFPGTESTDASATFPCFNVPFLNANTVNYVAVLVYTPGGSFCIQETGNQDAPACFEIEGTFSRENYQCLQVSVSGNETSFETSCDPCTTTDFTAFIRFITIGQPTDDEGVNCRNISDFSMYPSDLLTRPTNTASVDPDPTRATMGAITTRGSIVLLLLATLLAKIFT